MINLWEILHKNEIPLGTLGSKVAQKFNGKGEDVYSVLGQTDTGRYVIVFFVHKSDNAALIISARDMDSNGEKIMKEKDDAAQCGISKGRTIDEIAEYWDTHSLADHWDHTHEAPFEVRAQRKRRVTLDPELYEQIEAQARTRGVSTETLVNLWLVERLRTEKAA